ncbi:MAG: hypothetical protein ACI80P_001506 [Flavobacteriales bacterium]|jgi:hypothetical protein
MKNLNLLFKISAILWIGWGLSAHFSGGADHLFRSIW